VWFRLCRRKKDRREAAVTGREEIDEKETLSAGKRRKARVIKTRGKGSTSTRPGRGIGGIIH